MLPTFGQVPQQPPAVVIVVAAKQNNSETIQTDKNGSESRRGKTDWKIQKSQEVKHL